MGVAVKESGDKRSILLDGDLTLQNAESLRKAFLKALVESDNVSLVFKNVRNVDLSCLQLLCSAHRSAARLQKRLAIEGAVPKALKDAADEAGYCRLKGCKLDRDESCLWISVAGGNHE